MKLSYEGIGQWAATFAANQVEEGCVVKLSGNGEVSGCDAGDDFIGAVLAVGRDGAACSVALGGMVQVSYSGAAPAVGWCGLAADGKGGVQSGSHSYRVVDVDEENKTVTFIL